MSYFIFIELLLPEQYKNTFFFLLRLKRTYLLNFNNQMMSFNVTKKFGNMFDMRQRYSRFHSREIIQFRVRLKDNSA